MLAWNLLKSAVRIPAFAPVPDANVSNAFWQATITSSSSQDDLFSADRPNADRSNADCSVLTGSPCGGKGGSKGSSAGGAGGARKLSECRSASDLPFAEDDCRPDAARRSHHGPSRGRRCGAAVDPAVAALAVSAALESRGAEIALCVLRRDEAASTLSDTIRRREVPAPAPSFLGPDQFQGRRSARRRDTDVADPNVNGFLTNSWEPASWAECLAPSKYAMNVSLSMRRVPRKSISENTAWLLSPVSLSTSTRRTAIAVSNVTREMRPRLWKLIQ
mmetsp:Transcript_59974/g.152066  ORF Transcript_59974/g.152066 Transcript_59974/m.152066 type:complete len:276 (+) Transcript_59974:140-967(+)